MAIQNSSKEEIKKILQENKRIAVVGLSDQANKASYDVAKYMLGHGYEIIPVNPTVDSVFDIKAVASLKEIKGHVDIVNVFRRPEYLLDVAKDAVEIGADVYWAQLGISDQETFDYLNANGVQVIMDHCIKVEHMTLLG